MKMKFLWPPIETMAEADKVARDGAGVSFFVAVVTALIAYLQMNGMIDAFPHMDKSAYVDAVIFMGIGCLLLRCSRIAAVAGLLLYTFEQVMIALNTGVHHMSFVAIVIVFSYVNSVRATFRYQALKKTYSIREVSIPVTSSENFLPDPVRNKRAKLFYAAGLAAAGAVILCGIVYFAQGSTRTKPVVEPSYIEIENVSLPWSRKEGAPAAAETKASFKLKDGRTVNGKIKYEDEVYYTLETMTGEEIVIKEDIAP